MRDESINSMHIESPWATEARVLVNGRIIPALSQGISSLSTISIPNPTDLVSDITKTDTSSDDKSLK